MCSLGLTPRLPTILLPRSLAGAEDRHRAEALALSLKLSISSYMCVWLASYAYLGLTLYTYLYLSTIHCWCSSSDQPARRAYSPPGDHQR